MSSTRVLRKIAVILTLGLGSIFWISTGSPASAATPAIKVMPLGDSITDGFVVPGGYRTKLWTRTVATDADNIDYVGSLSGGPASLGDPNHEGHTGWCLDVTTLACGAKGKPLTSIIDARLATYTPDVILLHGGTNDLNDGYTGAQTATHLDTLMGKIFTDLPHVKLIVAKIIPAAFGATKQANWTAYENAIPGVVAKYQALGDDVTLVDFSTLLVPNTADYYQSCATCGRDSLHPSQQGYDKMADAWYPALTAAYQALLGTTPPPPPPVTDYFANCDKSVETGLSCWSGVYSSTSKVTWIATDGQDGTHSLRLTATTASGSSGINAKPAPVSATTLGTVYTGGAWVRASATGITTDLLLREKRADGTAAGYAVIAWTSADTNWHQLTVAYTAKEAGNSLAYQVYSPSLPSGAYVDTDVFSLTS
jgi:lysophospholipase L1-like esterase